MTAIKDDGATVEELPHGSVNGAKHNFPSLGVVIFAWQQPLFPLAVRRGLASRKAANAIHLSSRRLGKYGNGATLFPASNGARANH
jgi:hypothetical protein